MNARISILPDDKCYLLSEDLVNLTRVNIQTSSLRKVRFTQEQKNFLDLKYNHGEQTGKKSTGEDVARQMRRAHEKDEKRLFLNRATYLWVWPPGGRMAQRQR